MLRRHIILFIAIRPSDGDVKPGGSLGAFWEEQAMSQHRVSPSPFLSSSSLQTTQLHYTNSYTYSHPNLNFLQYTIQILVPHAMWSAQAMRDSKIATLNPIYPPCAEPEACNIAVGWHWNRPIFEVTSRRWYVILTTGGIQVVKTFGFARKYCTWKIRSGDFPNLLPSKFLHYIWFWKNNSRFKKSARTPHHLKATCCWTLRKGVHLPDHYYRIHYVGLLYIVLIFK